MAAVCEALKWRKIFRFSTGSMQVYHFAAEWPRARFIRAFYRYLGDAGTADRAVLQGIVGYYTQTARSGAGLLTLPARCPIFFANLPGTILCA